MESKPTGKKRELRVPHRIAARKNSKLETWLTAEGLQMIRVWAARGLSKLQISMLMGVSDTILEKWRKKSDPIDEALSAREEALTNVENALYKDCLGYYYEEEVVTNKGEVVWLKKFKQPVTAAQIFFLKNRLPSYWSDRREVNHIDDTSKVVNVKWGESKHEVKYNPVHTPSVTDENARKPGSIQDSSMR